MRYHTELPESAIRERVMACLAECGVEVFHDHLPASLTMGSARLAALARALVMDTELLCVDDALFGLDAEELVRFRGLLEKYRRDKEVTIVIGVNAQTSLFALMDRLVLIRDGRLVAVCPPAEASHVDDPMVRDFFGNN